MPEVPEISPAEFVRRWPEGSTDRSVVLLDVREPEELERASIQGTWHMPMRQVPSRLDELPRDKDVVVMCHLGGRSRRVAEYLVKEGFVSIYNLQGGIDAWSIEIDRSVPRY